MRYRLVVTGVALAAPFVGLVIFVLGSEIFSPLSPDARPAILALLPSAYLLGFLPNWFAIRYTTKVIRQHWKFRLWVVFGGTLFFALVPVWALVSINFDGNSLPPLTYFLKSTAISAIIIAITFLIMWAIGKKLLAWAGVSLNTTSNKDASA